MKENKILITLDKIAVIISMEWIKISSALNLECIQILNTKQDCDDCDSERSHIYLGGICNQAFFEIPNGPNEFLTNFIKIQITLIFYFNSILLFKTC